MDYDPLFPVHKCIDNFKKAAYSAALQGAAVELESL